MTEPLRAGPYTLETLSRTAPHLWVTHRYSSQDDAQTLLRVRADNTSTVRIRVDLTWNGAPAGGTPVFLDPGQQWVSGDLNLAVPANRTSIAIGEA